MKRLLIVLAIIISAASVFAKAPNLAVEKLFDGRYDKKKSVRTSIQKSSEYYYRSLHVTNNAEIVRTIESAIRQDSRKSEKVFEQSGEGGKSISVKIINNGEPIYMGIQQYNGSAFFYIKGAKKAFE